MEIKICILNYIIQTVGILIAVAFFTLYERKLLRYSQYRVGPNKVRIIGILQPIRDAIKLFSKERIVPFKSIKVMYIISPILTIFISLFIWLTCPYWFRGLEFRLSWLIIFCGMALNVMLVFMSGWSSNSKYSVLGSFRAIAQMISNEVVISFIIISYILFINRYILNQLKYKSFTILIIPLGILWFIISLSESQRTPFDLAEGESELVSGFNTEYSAINFALLFLGEYASILFIRLIRTILIFGLKLNRITLLVIFYIIFRLFIWCRSTFPRIRYDCLMMYIWKHLLTALLIVLCSLLFIKY